ncbi:hypothetical protein TRFO_18491 [Tritrichomonas foetus]|uniref:Uncharacterized protein n=1 Tax=Tritrichomonas foetus TaxID=1144522 RepID=A0A1J4KL04_9EUKA|nr:hypothetical protein TRFO_18491 [Tritrichomonas foetus]|eukprot:OHT11907.1 hypothetical protein TRFO_18491 [Tritrichomonas foetus]
MNCYIDNASRFYCLCLSTITIITTIFSSLFLIFSINKLETVKQFYPTIFTTESENTNLLNVALSNLNPQNLFAILNGRFKSDHQFTSPVSVPLEATILKMRLNQIVERRWRHFIHEEVSFTTSDISMPFNLTSVSTDSIDAVRIQLKLTGDTTFITGFEAEFKYVKNFELKSLKLFSGFFSLILLLVCLSYVGRINFRKERIILYSELYTILFSLFGVIILNPFLITFYQNDLEFSKYDYLRIPLFCILARYYITLLSLDRTMKVSKLAHIMLASFFVVFYGVETGQGFSKTSQISELMTLDVPYTLPDFLYIVVCFVYVGFAIKLCLQRVDSLIYQFLKLVNFEFALMSAILGALALFNRSVGWSGKMFLMISHAMITVICVLAMHPFKNHSFKKTSPDDEEPLVSSSPSIE